MASAHEGALAIGTQRTAVNPFAFRTVASWFGLDELTHTCWPGS